MQAIKNAIIFTVNEKNEQIRSGTIIWDQGKILALGNTENTPLPEGAEVIDGQNRLAVLPGLIDVHTHSSLLKGFSEDLNFLDWLPEYQREHHILTEEDAYYAFTISYLEALKGGTTCVLDMYRFMHQGAQVAKELGLRVNLAPYVADTEAATYFETLDQNESLIKKHHNTHQGRIRILVGLEHLFYCSDAAYKRARQLSEAYGVYIHTHTSEFEPEVQAVLKKFGKRPVSVLKDKGILYPRTILAHCTCLDQEELDILQDNDVRISHCPTSNVKLGGGTIKLRDVTSRGIKVGLGTDGSISNNSLSMWETMKFGSLLQKNLYVDATEVNASQVLRLATIEGARVLGLEDQVGSLEVGKNADLITVDLWQSHLMPVAASTDHDPILWNLVYAARASDVRDVWVAGQQVIAQGKSTFISEKEILERVHQQTLSLLERRESVKSKAFIPTAA